MSFWFSPVFHDSKDGFAIPTRSILYGPRAVAGALDFESDSVEVAGVAGPNGQVLRLSGSWKDGREVLAEANRLARRADAAFAEPDMLVSGRAHYTPNDPLFPNSWGLLNTGQYGGAGGFDVQATAAWDITLGAEAVITVILDTGVDQSHPDIHQIAGADFTDAPGINGGPANPCDVHGTPVAGVVSGVVNNGNGTAGIAPGTRVASARVFVSEPTCDERWYTFFSWTADALAWAESIGARVTNNSNGFDFPSSTIATAYQLSRDNGLIHFASAGNDAAAPTFPSSLSTVNAVGALDPSGSLSSFSNFGPEIFVVGPGNIIYTTDRQGSAGYSSGDYANVWGTSYASPFAAGIAALMISLDPSLTPDATESLMQQSARDLGAPGFDNLYGHGLVQARDVIDLFFVFADGFETGDSSQWN